MIETQILSYQKDDGSKLLFNNNANISEELENFLSDKKLDKTEIQALHYILYNNKSEEILKSSDGLADLAKTLKYIPIKSDKYEIKSRINNILKLSSKSSKIEKGNKQQNYRSLKNESKKLGKTKIIEFQKKIGTKPDGSFGPNTFKKYKEFNSNWENENITDFLNKNSGNKINKQENLWDKFIDLFDGNSENKSNSFKQTKEDKIFTEKVISHENIMKLLEGADKRTLKNIISLSDKYNFKNNVVNFYLDCIKNGYNIKIIEGKRTIKEQAIKVKKGYSKTMNSAHVKGLAIDVIYKGNGNLPKIIKQIAAKYNLINGAEMWGWDGGHFQAYYQGNTNKNVMKKTFEKMTKNGTLPRNYENYFS